VAEVQDGDSGALVRLADGTERAYDLVIGADGYRSVARASLFPGSEPGFAGYIGWRGTFPAKRLDEIDGRPGWDTRESVTIGFDGGHLMAYRIPGDAGEIINWLIYATPPAGIDVRPESPAGFPPGRVTEDLIRHFHALAEDRLPPYWADAVRLTDPERLFVQPIYDLEAPTYAGRRVLLMGDAAVVARPHTGAGAVKALQDVAIMEELWHDAESWEQLLASYDAVRRPVGHAVVELGRRIGRAQVIEARDWGRHDQASFDAWIREQLGVESLGSRALGRP
jgi:2-polyprenyl-6-methoxyphenol hydroxylase-like FAD-dependent oxidoreductase